jgi:hypothetical protein
MPLTEIDIEKRQGNCSGYRTTSYQLPNLSEETRNWSVRLLMFLWKHKEQQENQGSLYLPSIASWQKASEIGLVQLLLPQHYYMMLWKILLPPLG